MRLHSWSLPAPCIDITGIQGKETQLMSIATMTEEERTQAREPCA